MLLFWSHLPKSPCDKSDTNPFRTDSLHVRYAGTDKFPDSDLRWGQGKRNTHPENTLLPFFHKSHKRSALRTTLRLLKNVHIDYKRSALNPFPQLKNSTRTKALIRSSMTSRFDSPIQTMSCFNQTLNKTSYSELLSHIKTRPQKPHQTLND